MQERFWRTNTTLATFEYCLNLDNGLKFAFFLGTVLTVIFTLNVVAQIASAAGVTTTVVNLLWFAYRLGLYMFWGLLLYVLVKLTTELQIRKNPPPKMGSPMQMARQRREARHPKQW